MIDTPKQRTKPSLGLGQIIAQAGNIYGRKCFWIFILCAPVVALSFVTMGYVWPPRPTFLENTPPPAEPSFWLIWTWNIGTAAGQAIVTVLMVHLTVAASAGRRLNLRVAPKTLPGSVPPIALLALLPVVLLFLGQSFRGPWLSLYVLLVLLLILILQVILFVAAPCMVMERCGLYRSVQRSLRLTAGYRWPILPLVLLIYFVVIVIGLSPYLTSVVPYGNFVDIVPDYLLFTAIPLTATLTYLRLRDIKDGTPAPELAEVFA